MLSIWERSGPSFDWIRESSSCFWAIFEAGSPIALWPSSAPITRVTSTISASTAARPRRVLRLVGSVVGRVGIGSAAAPCSTTAVGQARASAPELSAVANRRARSVAKRLPRSDQAGASGRSRPRPLPHYDRRMPEEFCDVGRGVTLCYETFGDPDDTPILLVMGLATQMIAWHEDFCEQLAERGFYVVRFDNRDIGRSTHFDFRPPTRGPDAPPPLSDPSSTRSPTWLRTPPSCSASSEIAPAHVVGASMGGMIGQMLAAEHPERVRSLTSIMSTTGSRWHGQPAPSVYRYLLRPPPRDRDGYIERAAEIFGLVGSTGFAARRAVHPRARRPRLRPRLRRPRPAAASSARSSPRATAPGKLRRIKAPTLVIHGTVDKMIRPSGGRATAKAIPGARLMMIEGMGHDLPRGVWPQIIDAIAEHARAATAAAAAVAAALSGGRSRATMRVAATAAFMASRDRRVQHVPRRLAIQIDEPSPDQRRPPPASPGRGTRPRRRSPRARARGELLLQRHPVVRVVDVAGRIHLRRPEAPGPSAPRRRRLRVAQAHIGVAAGGALLIDLDEVGREAHRPAALRDPGRPRARPSPRRRSPPLIEVRRSAEKRPMPLQKVRTRELARRSAGSDSTRIRVRRTIQAPRPSKPASIRSA